MNPKLSTFGNTFQELSDPTKPVVSASSNPENTPVLSEPISVVPDSDKSVSDPEPTQAQTGQIDPALPSENGLANEEEFDISIPGQTAINEDDVPNQTHQPQNIDDVLKTTPAKDILKKLGIHDFAIEINDHLARGGNALDYINAKAIDWNVVPDEEIMLSKIKAQYPNFSPEEVRRLYNQKYGSGISEDEIADQALILKADAYTERQARIQKQQGFKLPDPVQVKDEKYENWVAAMQNEQQEHDRLMNYYNNHEATKSLAESKRVTVSLGEGVPPFNFKLKDPDVIMRALTDDGTILKSFLSTETGEPDVQKEQLVTLFAMNPQKFMQSIFNYGMSQAAFKRLAEGQGAARPNAAAPLSDVYEAPTYRQGKFADKPRV